jgi:hypothetical protein
MLGIRVSRLHEGEGVRGHRIVIASQKAGRVYRPGREARHISSYSSPTPFSPFLIHMFVARNATRALKRNNPHVANLTTLRTFHTTLTNLNKMSEETKQQIKTAFPELLNIAKQKTTLPGREKDMTPIAKHTELECVAFFGTQPVVRRNIGTLNETFFFASALYRVWTNEGEPQICDVSPFSFPSFRDRTSSSYPNIHYLSIRYSTRAATSSRERLRSSPVPILGSEGPPRWLSTGKELSSPSLISRRRRKSECPRFLCPIPFSWIPFERTYSLYC